MRFLSSRVDVKDTEALGQKLLAQKRKALHAYELKPLFKDGFNITKSDVFERD